MIKIITDSSANISQEEAKELGITVLPLGVSFGAEAYLDGKDLSTDEFYEKLTSSKEFPHTSQLSREELQELFERESKNADEVIVMFLAKCLSGTHALAQKVAQEGNFANVHVYDTRATTAVLRILVCEAVKNAEKPVDEVIAILDELRPRIKLYAALDTLEYLKKGGRLSGTATFIGNVLKIKPVIYFTDECEVKIASKQIGFTLALKSLAEKVKSGALDGSQPIYYLYTKEDANCNAMIEKLKLTAKEKAAGQKINICPVIGTHIGPRAAGIVFVESKKSQKI